jgi:hypothetical protein
MKRYEIKGEEEMKGEAKRVGKVTAVIVPREWEGSEVVAIKNGEIEAYKKIEEGEAVR